MRLRVAQRRISGTGFRKAGRPRPPREGALASLLESALGGGEAASALPHPPPAPPTAPPPPASPAAGFFALCSLSASCLHGRLGTRLVHSSPSSQDHLPIGGLGGPPQTRRGGCTCNARTATVVQRLRFSVLPHPKNDESVPVSAWHFSMASGLARRSPLL